MTATGSYLYVSYILAPDIGVCPKLLTEPCTTNPNALSASRKETTKTQKPQIDLNICMLHTFSF